MIMNNEIDLTHCFKIVDDTLFRKVRNVQMTQRTPPITKNTKETNIKYILRWYNKIIQ